MLLLSLLLLLVDLHLVHHPRKHFAMSGALLASSLRTDFLIQLIQLGVATPETPPNNFPQRRQGLCIAAVGALW